MSTKNRILDTGVQRRTIAASTPGLASKRPAFTEIPIVDFSAMQTNATAAKTALAAELYRACTEVGFFYISHHGINRATIDQLFAASRDFFNLPEADKKQIDIAHSAFNRGYIPLYGEKNNEHSKGDVKETFDVAIEITADDPDFVAGNPLYGPNQWPDGLPRFRPAISAYFDALSTLCTQLYRAFALALQLPEDYFLGQISKPLDILRLLRYPAQPLITDTDQIGTGAHSDFDCFTVLYQDSVGGLQVLNSRGEWIDALPVEGTFLINIGDMMERWTNGLFVSTVHRVINRSATERYSSVFFAAPDYHTEIACLPGCCSADNPPKYPPISAGEYIISRYEAILS